MTWLAIDSRNPVSRRPCPSDRTCVPSLMTAVRTAPRYCFRGDSMGASVGGAAAFSREHIRDGKRELRSEQRADLLAGAMKHDRIVAPVQALAGWIGWIAIYLNS